MWIRRSHVLTPLTRLTSDGVPWNWTNVERKAFHTMKKIISRETLLAYPNFNEPFVIHTDASKTQLGAVISQNNRPIAFYSKKLNPAQTRYTTTERELLSIVETLKEFRSILLGHQIIIHTDHKNLTYKQFNTDRVMRWRLIIEEYSPTLQYIKGTHNVVADALSRLDLIKDFSSEQSLFYFSEQFGLDKKDLPLASFPLSYQLISKLQQEDKSLIATAKANEAYKMRIFHTGRKKINLIVNNGKIVIPSPLQAHLVDWYHTMLCHPGETRTEHTIRQHFYWKNLRGTVFDVCSKCDRCQCCKKKSIKYGHLPAKVAEVQPWDTLCVDLIGPYKFFPKGNKKAKPFILHCLTMIDPATSWFEIVAINNKTAMEIANLVETQWLTRYPWPTQIILDRGKEFMGEFMRMVKADYGILRKPITTRNPQANSIIERVHQTIGNMIRTMQPQNLDLEMDDPWTGVLSAVAFAIRATYHTTLQATPAQLVFGRDAILNVKHEANWHYIKQRKQDLINKNNLLENAKRKPYCYKVGDKVLLKNDLHWKYGQDPYSGPYTILKVNDNGTAFCRQGAISDTFNLRNLHPYKD
jgi:RNase H-like domain found in reverse transcriptase/Integrase zinc binding domain